MISNLIYALLDLMVLVTELLLSPLDNLIVNHFPNFGDTLTKISNFMSLPFEFMGWVFELVHIPSICLTLIIASFVFKYFVIGASSGIKFAISLYQRFKP